jgi:hypothetical protein
MHGFLNSPFAIGLCLAALLPWVAMVCAIFWPGKSKGKNEDEPHIRF